MTDLITRLMNHVEETMCEAQVDYPAGHRAGASVAYDSGRLEECFEKELAAERQRLHEMRRPLTIAWVLAVSIPLLSLVVGVWWLT